MITNKKWIVLDLQVKLKYTVEHLALSIKRFKLQITMTFKRLTSSVSKI